MNAELKTFTIHSTASGVLLGTYDAPTEEEALTLLAIDAGYESAVQMSEESIGSLHVEEATDEQDGGLAGS